MKNNFECYAVLTDYQQREREISAVKSKIHCSNLLLKATTNTWHMSVIVLAWQAAIHWVDMPSIERQNFISSFWTLQYQTVGFCYFYHWSLRFIMVRNVVEEVGTCVTRLEFQQSQHWPAKVNKFYSHWTLLVERDPPLDTVVISMKFDCVVPCFGKCNTIMHLSTCDLNCD